MAQATAPTDSAASRSSLTSAIGGIAEKMCSLRAFRSLTRTRHLMRLSIGKFEPAYEVGASNAPRCSDRLLGRRPAFLFWPVASAHSHALDHRP